MHHAAMASIMFKTSYVQNSQCHKKRRVHSSVMNHIAHSRGCTFFVVVLICLVPANVVAGCIELVPMFGIAIHAFRLPKANVAHSTLLIGLWLRLCQANKKPSLNDY